ncbi:MAG: PAS domain S-box protein, partial [Sulfurimonadaceae bacterium]|nr:PAS domain S-box protein [Sulfurimonadaceae bacterium]
MINLRILVVDDDKTTGATLKQLLDSRFSHVDTAANAQIALLLFASYKHDIILSGLHLSAPENLEMIKEIRKNHRHVKVGVFLNSDYKNVMPLLSQLNVNQFFCKPLNKEHFLKGVQHLSDEILEKRRIETTLKRQKNILHTINNMAERFLQHTDWNEALRRQMLSLKSAAEASAVFIFKNEDASTPQVAREYLTINDDPNARELKIISYRSLELIPWRDSLSNGQTIKGLIGDFPAAEQHLLYNYSINSLLMIPIFSDSRWWGFMGIGNTDGRLFDDMDTRTLDTVARIIGSAVNNQNNMRTLEMTSAIFKHTVDGVVITNAENKIIHTNQAFTDITGYTQSDVLGKNPKVLRSRAHDKKFYGEMWRQIHTN